MKMFIKDLSFGAYAITNASTIKTISKLLQERLTSKGILYNMKLDNNIIQFSVVEGKSSKRLFMYSGHNHVKLSPTDPRIAQNKRDFLLSHRLTEAQVKLVWEKLINGTLDSIGVSCNIVLQEFIDDPASTTPVREGFIWGEWQFKDKQYPVEAK